MASAAAAVAGGVTSGSSRKRLMRDEDMTKVEFETSEEVDVTPTFDTMGLREDLLRGIYAYGERGKLIPTGGCSRPGTPAVLVQAAVCILPGKYTDSWSGVGYIHGLSVYIPRRVQFHIE